MKYKFNPLTGEFNLVPDSGTLKQKLNWLTGEFNLTKDASKYKQIYNVIEGEFNLYPATTQVVIHGVGSVQLTNAVENGLLSLTAFGGTEQRNLPSGYTQYEYLRSSGTQYIDLGYKGNGNTKVEVKFKYHTATSSTGSGRVFGSRITSSNNAFAIGTASGVVSDTTNKIFWCYDGQPYYVYNTEFGLDVWQTVVFSATEHTINGVIVGDDYEITEFETPNNLLLFAFDNNGTVGVGYVDIAYCKLWNNGVLVMDLIPAKNTSNVIGMYDLVSGQFFANAGTGTFTAGPDVVPTPTAPIDIVSNNGVLKARHQSGLPIGYTLLDYIKSGGSNYIDTGIKITNEDIIEMQYLQTADKGAIYGEYYNGTANMSTTLYGNLTFYFYGYNAGGTATSVGDYDTNVHTVVHNFVDGYIDFDGVRTNFDLPSPNSFTNTLNCPIFGRSNGSTIGYFSKTQLYYFRIRRNGTLILDLIPAKDSNNNVGMYDRVSGTLFTESGSGSFTAGNTVADPMTVYADGTTETIWSHGKNLFNKSDIITGKILNDTGAEIAQSSGYYSGHISVNASTKYTISQTGGQEIYLRILEYDATDTMVKLNKGTTDGTQTKTFTTGATTTYVIVSGGSKNNALDTIQLELGSTATEYAPYYDGGTATAEMLLKVGDYADEQEILSGNITRKVGIMVLDGTENWQLATATDLIQFYTPKTQGIIANNVSLYSTIAPYGCTVATRAQYDFGCYSGNSGNLCFQMKGSATLTTLSAWTQFLTAQYNAGTPVIVVYPLATPTTESVAGQTMNIPSGNSTIEITQASLDNLELEATYEQEA